VPLSAYIDESGGRAHTNQSTDHFVMTAVVFRDVDRPRVCALLAQLRSDLGRRPGDPLHWVNIRGHGQRLHAARTLGLAEYLTISSVVVCKRHFAADDLIHEEDASYLHTLRYLLERLSWLGAPLGGAVEYTLAHIVRFQVAKLRQYEARLKADRKCTIRWDYLRPGRIDQPTRVEELQLADLAASATAAAFEPDRFGNTEPRYLVEMAPRIYRHRGNLTSYGLKMHPWNAAAKAAYPWVHAL
jgi:Protein of unknown function (DUF3800)